MTRLFRKAKGHEAKLAYQGHGLMENCHGLAVEGCVTPHVAQNTSNRSSAIDERTARHAGYGVSRWRRKRVEEIFGGLQRQRTSRRSFS